MTRRGWLNSWSPDETPRRVSRAGSTKGRGSGRTSRYGRGKRPEGSAHGIFTGAGPLGPARLSWVECLAGEAGVPVVKLKNFREKMGGLE